MSSSGLQRRDRGEEVETRQSVLRLFRVSKLQHRLLGQARLRHVSSVQRALPSRKDHEKAGDVPLLRERRLRLQIRSTVRDYRKAAICVTQMTRFSSRIFQN